MNQLERILHVIFIATFPFALYYVFDAPLWACLMFFFLEMDLIPIYTATGV